MTREERIEALTTLKEQARYYGDNTFVWSINIDSFNFVIDSTIKALEQEPKTGHWIEKGKTDIAYDMCGYKSWATKYMCNHCGFIHAAIENHGVYSYCPNCGVKMVEPQESEG